MNGSGLVLRYHVINRILLRLEHEYDVVIPNYKYILQTFLGDRTCDECGLMVSATENHKCFVMSTEHCEILGSLLIEDITNRIFNHIPLESNNIAFLIYNRGVSYFCCICCGLPTINHLSRKTCSRGIGIVCNRERCNLPRCQCGKGQYVCDGIHTGCICIKYWRYKHFCIVCDMFLCSKKCANRCNSCGKNVCSRHYGYSIDRRIICSRCWDVDIDEYHAEPLKGTFYKELK